MLNIVSKCNTDFKSAFINTVEPPYSGHPL